MLVVTEQQAQDLVDFIRSNEVLAYDTETDGLNTRKNTIIGFSISNEYSGFYVPIYRFDVETGQLQPYGLNRTIIKLILSELSKKKLLMYNASFDTRMTRHSLGIDLLPALHADVLLMKHTCDEEFPFGLKEVATMLWGHDVKKEKEEMQASIKTNGGTKTEYYKADVELLSKYGIQDSKLTYKLYNYYSRELTKQGLDDFYYKREVMPLYKLVTIPMEERGLALDLPKLTKAKEDIIKHIQSLEQGIQDSIMPHLKLFYTWFLNKDYPLITYKGTDTLLGKRYKADSRGGAPEFYQSWHWRKDNPGEHVYMFNLQSKHHLKKLFFDTLGETPVSRTEKGNPQVDESFLELMAEKYPWCSKLVEYNKLQKIKGTYIDRLLEEQENGIFYPSFMQHRTVSGRYASDMQQLPRPVESTSEKPIPETVVHFTNLIREFIIARPGQKLISADYEQLEPSIFAHTSGDPALKEIFNEGKDFYSTVAIRTERLTGVSAEKSASNYLGKANSAARQKAKAYALGIAYGMTGYKLKFELGCTEEEAEKLVNDYLTAFSGLKAWMYASRDTVKLKGCIAAESGRLRHMPQAKTIYEKYGPCIDNDLDLWKRYNKVPAVYEKAKADRRVYKNLMNNAINFQVQSLAASVINQAAIRLAERGFIPVAQVHDELVYDESESTLVDTCNLIQNTMQDVGRTMRITVPLRTTPQIGTNYRQCK